MHLLQVQCLSPNLTCDEHSVALPPLYSQPCQADSDTARPRLAAVSVVLSTVLSLLPVWGPRLIQQWSSDTYTWYPHPKLQAEGYASFPICACSVADSDVNIRQADTCN